MDLAPAVCPGSVLRIPVPGCDTPGSDPADGGPAADAQAHDGTAWRAGERRHHKGVRRHRVSVHPLAWPPNACAIEQAVLAVR